MYLRQYVGMWAHVGGGVYGDFQSSRDDFSKASLFLPDLWGWSSPPDILESLPPLLNIGCSSTCLLEMATWIRRRRLNFKGQKGEYQEMTGFRVGKMKC